MSFPIHSKSSTSLYFNIASGLRPLPLEVRPPLEKVFAKLAELMALVSLNPGNARELCDCATLLSRQAALSESEQNSYKNLMHQTLKVQRIAQTKCATDPKPIGNLTDALRAQRSNPPPFVQLLKVIKEIIRLTGLEFWPLTQLILALRDPYPYEERSQVDKKAWAEFADFYENQPSRLNQQLGEFARGFDQAETRREQVKHLREIAQQETHQRLKTLFQCRELQEGDWRGQSLELQRLLNALLAEQRLEGHMSDFLDKLRRFLIPAKRALVRANLKKTVSAERAALAPLDELTTQRAPSIWNFKNAYREVKKLNIESINDLISGWNEDHREKMTDLFHEVFDKIEKILAGICVELGKNFSHHCNELAQRAFRQLDRLKGSLPQLIASKAPEEAADTWQNYIGYFEREIDLHIFEFRARTLLMQLVDVCSELFKKWPARPLEKLVALESEGCEKLPLSSEIARAAIPALVAAEGRFTRFWSGALTASDPIEPELQKGIEDLSTALSLLRIAGPSRDELYVNLRAKLQELQPKKGSERRQALQFTKVLLYFPDFEGVLPASLAPSLTPGANGKPRAKARLKKTALALSNFAAPGEESIFDSVLENLAIVPRGPSTTKLGTWTPPFSYHRRVARWFDAKPPLNAKLFPEYCRKTLAYQQTMVRLHHFIPLADFFCQRGIKLLAKSSRGEAIQRLVLPAELRTNEGQQRGVIIWATNSQNICYHRFFHVKLDTDLLLNTVQKAFEKSQSDSLGDEDFNGLKLQFTDREEDLVEVDELSGTALLRQTTSENLELRLKFIV